MADKKLTAMRRSRAKHFPKKTCAGLLQFHVQAVNGRICFKIMKPGADPFCFDLAPEDAYEVREDIGYAYDEANGLSLAKGSDLSEFE